MKHIKMVGLSLFVGYVLYLIMMAAFSAPVTVGLTFFIGSLTNDILRSME